MIYSRWDPATGRYDYYDAPDRIGLNDDLPVPTMPAATKLGVPSVECGRPLPRGAKHAGQGETARGSITPPALVQLAAGAVQGVWGERMLWIGVGVAAGGLLTYLATRRFA